MNSSKERGFATLIVIGIVVALVFAATAVYYLSKTDKNYPGKQYVQKVYTPERTTEEISDSDDTKVIEKELDETDLKSDDLDKDLEDIDKSMDSL